MVQIEHRERGGMSEHVEISAKTYGELCEKAEAIKAERHWKTYFIES